MDTSSRSVKLFAGVIVTQGFYTLITAIWPLVHIDSFIFVTGPKTDVWLVKTVGALLIPIAVTLLSYLFIKSDPRHAILLGSLTAVAFICIDFYYALTNVISDIYLADAILEILFLTAWMVVAWRNQQPMANH